MWSIVMLFSQMVENVLSAESADTVRAREGFVVVIYNEFSMSLKSNRELTNVLGHGGRNVHCA
jgi:hypothetical protein